MGAILKRELGSFFNSAIAYVVMAVFFFFSGYFFYVFCLSYDSANLTYVYSNMFFIILFIVPIITMKSFSEEKRQKTDQALLTSPTSLFQIVMGKFLGAFVLYAICCAVFIIYALVISFFTAPDWSVILCTTIGILLLGGALIAIDIFISSLTESQVISAVAGFAIGIVIYLMSNFTSSIPFAWLASILETVNFLNYYQNFTYGVLRLSDVVFFLSIIGLFLFFTIRVFEKKRWS
ncbi:MAG: ABC transporter permease [Ruminococcus sp.]|nr:ABC transporter permease [Ruminococcus sp.]